ncbi:hypothetical protein XENOCAPTIV_004120 [Xenoophorus captivus]|uniref:Uncharacterized protein n=1 Tax=Xenoophorus captivus TaxID=1517983 RepID=A0ABV0QZA3_9TELE
MDMADKQVFEATRVEQFGETVTETLEDVHIEETVVLAVEGGQVGESVDETPGEEFSEVPDEAEGEVVHEHTAKRRQIECQLCEHRRVETHRLLEENRELRSELKKRQLDKDFLKDDTKKLNIIPDFFVFFLSNPTEALKIKTVWE